MTQLLLQLVVVGSFAFRHSRPATFLIDTSQFLRAARKIREERAFPEVLDYNLMDVAARARWDYPPLLVLLLALLPTDRVERHLRVVAAANDALATAAVGLAAGLLGGPAAGWLAAALYSCTPSIVQQSAMLTARFLSIALLTSSLALHLHHLASGAAWSFGAGVAAAALLLLCNALAIQAWVLVTAGLALTGPHPAASLLYLAASFAACYLLAGRIAWRVHVGLVVKLGVLRRHRLDDLRIARVHPLQRLRGEAGAGAARWSGLRIALRSFLLVDYPWVWAAAAALPSSLAGGWTAVHGWLALLLGCHLLVDTLPSLRFVGPGHRYLSYGLLPAALLLAPALESGAPVVERAALLAALVAGAALSVRRLRIVWRVNHLPAATLRAVGATLRDLPVERVLSLPFHLSDPLGYFSGKRFLHGWASRAWAVGPTHGLYPVLERPVQEVVDHFALDALVLHLPYVRIEELGLERFRTLAEHGDFVVYGVEPAARAAVATAGVGR